MLAWDVNTTPISRGIAMTRFPPVVVAFVSMTVPCLAAGQEDSATVLENQALELHVKRLPTPHVDKLVHKPSGTAVVSGSQNRDLFQIVLDDIDGKKKTVSASTARRSDARMTEKDGERVLAMQWSGFPELDMSVRATVRCLTSEPLTLWSIEVDNRSGSAMSLVRFPYIMTPPQIGQPEDDFLVLPALPGVRIDNPAARWPEGRTVKLDYPGGLSAQFLTWQDRSAGVYLAGRDSESHPMALGVAKRSSGFQLWHEYVIPSSLGKGPWKSPYPVAVGVTQGSWHESADLYKRWAVEQPWCEKTLAHRDDIPDWWKTGPDVHVCGVRTYDKDRVCNGSYYPKLLEYLQDYRRKIDGPVVPMLASWEQHRRWTAGDYFPVFDEPQAKQVIRLLHQNGFRPFFFLSGLYYTFENEGVNGSQIPSAANYLQHYVIDEESGKPRVFVLNESNPTRHWKRNSYEFCVGDPATTEFFCGVIDRAHELGVDVLQMDQTTTGAGHSCYSHAHNHEPGVGLYQTHGFQELLQTMRNHGKRKTKDFVLFHEEPHEQLIPFLDGFHVREYKEKWWYRGHPGAVGIPLFSYLYHEFAIGYGGDSAPLNPSSDRRMVRSHAVNLVTGRTPGGSVWSSQQSMFNAHPDQITMLRNHSRLLKTQAKEFLILGRMLHPFELDVPKLTFRWSLGRGKNAKTETTEDPAILTSSWQSPSGKVGHLFVNISEKPQALTVQLDTRNASGWPKCDVDLCSSEEDSEFRPLWRQVTLPREFTRELQPLEVAFLEVRQPDSRPETRDTQAQ